jgi:transcription termination factor Rho
MSGYRYDYPLARAPRSPWRSAFTTIAAAATIAIVSGIGGAAVVLELVAPAKGPADAAGMSNRERAALSTTAPLSEPRNDSKTANVSKIDTNNKSVRVIASGSPAPTRSDGKSARPATTGTAPPPPAVEAQPLAPAAPPPVAVAAQAAPAAAPAESHAAAPAESRPATELSANDLTFKKGYAKRRAAREAAMKAAGLDPRKEDARKGNAKETKEARESQDSKEANESKEVRKSEKVARKHRANTETAYRSERSNDRYSDRYNDRNNDRYRDRYNDRYNDRYAERFERREMFGFSDDYPRPTRRGIFGDFF